MADAGLRVSANSIEELFEDAARGMFAIISGEKPPGWDETRRIHLEAVDRESLLVDWLSELLYLLEVKLFWTIEPDVKIEGETLEASIGGVKMEGTVSGTEIKAVTYHMLEIHESGGRFETDIFFDL